MTAPDSPRSAAELRSVFDSATSYTVGVEEEVMLLDAESFELVPRAEEVLDRVSEDDRFKAELPASQVEIATRPTDGVADAVESLFQARRQLAEATDGLVRLGVAGVHPFSPGVGALSRLERYERTIREYGPVAARELVCALQVHVSIGDAARALAVYNAARSYLPLLGALAANAPFYEGRDTGLASVRPKLAELLPRHGVPPPLASWEDYAEVLRWGAETGRFPDVRNWWWELRPHSEYGTLEFRVPDGQISVREAAAIIGVVYALVVWLGERHDRGEWLAVAPSWQIAENSWSACRWGLDGTMVELQTGVVRRTREALEELLAVLEPTAQLVGAKPGLDQARALIARNGALAQRDFAAEHGIPAIAQWLSERFLEPWPG